MNWSAEDFEPHRAHLRAVAYRMLGSLADADDAVQETWLRLSGSGDVRNLRAWLTTVTSRICLDMLRSRGQRREDPLGVHVPDPIVTAARDAPAADGGPESDALLADSVGLALLVVLETLTPAERLAFVLHDVFAVPFAQVAAALDRSPAAAKQLASRARQRLRGAAADSPPDPGRQQQVVDAFLAASRDGDFARLMRLLDPDVVLRADAGSGPFAPSRLIRGRDGVVAQARRFVALAGHAHRVLVNGAPGILVAPNGRPLAVIAVAVRGGTIAEIDILADPERLARLDLAGLAGPGR